MNLAIKKGDRIRVMRVITRMNIGGPAIQITGLLRGLSKEKFEHRLYTGYCHENEAEYLDGIEQDFDQRIYRIVGLGRPITILDDLKAFTALFFEIRRFKPHIIHTHTTKAGVICRLASLCSFHKSIRIHTFHGHLLAGYFSRSKTRLYILVEKILSSFTHVLVAVGNNVKTDLINAGIGNEKKFQVIPPGVSLGALKSRVEACASLNLNAGLIQCAFVGRLTQIKRLDRFLDVVTNLKSQGVNMHFIIAGNGEMANYCRNRIDREQLPVMMLGWQSEIENVFAASDLVILTSDNEGTPLSLIQAGLAGKPVVATRVGSVEEIVDDGKTGLLCEPVVPELAAAILSLSIDAERREQMGQLAKSVNKKKFSFQELAMNHEKLYLKSLI